MDKEKYKNWSQFKKQIFNKVKKQLIKNKEINLNIFLKNNTKKLKKGIYILHNKTKNKFYIEQAKNFKKRIKSHFTKRENKENRTIYQDYKKNNHFTVKIITTNKLDKTEKITIWFFLFNNKKLYNKKTYWNIRFSIYQNLKNIEKIYKQKLYNNYIIKKILYRFYKNISYIINKKN